MLHLTLIQEVHLKFKLVGLKQFFLYVLMHPYHINDFNHLLACFTNECALRTFSVGTSNNTGWKSNPRAVGRLRGSFAKHFMIKSYKNKEYINGNSSPLLSAQITRDQRKI